MNQNSQGGYSHFSGNNDFMSQVCFSGPFPFNTVSIITSLSEPFFLHMQEYMAQGGQGLFTQAGFIDSSQDDGQQNPFGVNNPNLQSQVCPSDVKNHNP